MKLSPTDKTQTPKYPKRQRRKLLSGGVIALVVSSAMLCSCFRTAGVPQHIPEPYEHMEDAPQNTEEPTEQTGETQEQTTESQEQTSAQKR